MTEEATTTIELDSAPFERMATVMEAVAARMEALEAGLPERITQAVTAALPPAVEPATGDPERRVGVLTGGAGEMMAGPLDGVWDRFDQMEWTRSDFEVAAMLFEGTHRMRRPINLEMPDDLRAGWQHHVFERGRRPQVVGADGKTTRAMDTQETGFGAELVGVQYVAELWAAARNNDSLVNRIRTIPMTAPTTQIPIDGELPEMLFVAENTADAPSPYAVSGTGSSRATLTAKKFTIQQRWSAELTEDSIIQFVPFLREKLGLSVAAHLGSAYYNGDTTNAATGNINLDDADPANTKHYLAWDGIRHYWLVDLATQGKDMAAALNLDEIQVARGKLNAQGNDIDNAVKTVNWGMRAADLLLVADMSTYLSLLNTEQVETVEKYGAQATVVTGELGRIYGIPIVSPAYASRTDVDGKAVNAEASNVKGQITIFNPSGFLAGNRRSVEIFMDRVQGTDQFLIELYLRHAFTRHGAGVAAGIYNIT